MIFEPSFILHIFQDLNGNFDADHWLDARDTMVILTITLFNGGYQNVISQSVASASLGKLLK